MGIVVSGTNQSRDKIVARKKNADDEPGMERNDEYAFGRTCSEWHPSIARMLRWRWRAAVRCHGPKSEKSPKGK